MAMNEVERRLFERAVTALVCALAHDEAAQSGASAEELARPAVVESFGFAGAFPLDGRAVVRLSPAALAAPGPRHRVRWLMLSWSWEAGHPQDERWRARVETSFPFDRLRALLEP